MKVVVRSIVTAALFAAPAAAAWAQNFNPGNEGGGNAPIAVPNYTGDPSAGIPDESSNPALTTGSRLSVTANTPAYENPTVPGATGSTIVIGNRSTISGDRRATTEQKTGGSASDAPG
jgi:hypothetical protein